MRLLRSGAVGTAFGVLLLLPGGAPLAAQRVLESDGESAALLPPVVGRSPSAGAAWLLAEDSWVPPVASAVVPGSGQLLQGRRRGWLYLALEAAVWTGYALERHRGSDDRRAYRDLAWEVARIPAGPRTDGDFEYYERMSYWLRSGAFDADPQTDGLQPELDRTTFNGDAWRLAASIFLGGEPADPSDPGYGAALDYYRARAYAEGFLWDWTMDPGAQEQYRELIRESDSHFRNASLILGGALVNRLASSLDAVLTRRAGRPAMLRVLPEVTPGRPLRQTVLIRVILK